MTKHDIMETIMVGFSIVMIVVPIVVGIFEDKKDNKNGKNNA